MLGLSRRWDNLWQAAAVKTNKAFNRKSDETVVESFPQASEGKARDLAAAQLGISGKTAQKAVAVVEEIDKKEEAGDTAGAEELRQTLRMPRVAPGCEHPTRVEVVSLR